MRGTTSYHAQNGKVYAKTPNGSREVSTALSANGRELARFEKALQAAKRQRETTRNLYYTPEEGDWPLTGPATHKIIG